MPRAWKLLPIILSVTLFIIAGCSSPKTSEPPQPSAADIAPVEPPVETAAVSAEQGGEGFTGEGWQTNSHPQPLGDPKAVKGGAFRAYFPSFPPTLRMAGPDSSTDQNYEIGENVYETLISLDPITQDYVPSLATHWQISADKLTLRFRLNPKARFSNGEPVTSEDVIASWALLVDKTLADPSRNAQFGRFQKPVAESRYIVSVKTSKADWRDLQDFGTWLLIYPASSLKNLTGAQYIEKYNFAYLPGSGPYIVNPSDIKKQESITMRRRKDYWGENEPVNKGLNNFDEIRWTVVTDQSLAFEMFKKGELDYFFINQVSVWRNGFDFDAANRGLIQRRKVFNVAPQALQGFALNTRRAPFDDIRVRKAFALLFDRQKLIEQLYFNEYVANNTYFAGTTAQNPANPPNLYDPQEALKLLADAGWKDRDSSGRLTKNGKPLVVELIYQKDPGAERFLVVYQEDLRKVGITMELTGLSFPTIVQMTRRDRQFDICLRIFGLPYPLDPEQDWHPRLADIGDNNNITGFKDPKMTEILGKYAASFTVKERTELLRQLDNVMANQYHYIFMWTAPYKRLAFWNKFGQPPGYLTRIGDWNSDLALGPGPERLWYVDPAKEAALKKAQADPDMKLPIGPLEDKSWLEYKEPPKPK